MRMAVAKLYRTLCISKIRTNLGDLYTSNSEKKRLFILNNKNKANKTKRTTEAKLFKITYDYPPLKNTKMRHETIRNGFLF